MHLDAEGEDGRHDEYEIPIRGVGGSDGDEFVCIRQVPFDAPPENGQHELTDGSGQRPPPSGNPVAEGRLGHRLFPPDRPGFLTVAQSLLPAPAPGRQGGFRPRGSRSPFHQDLPFSGR